MRIILFFIFLMLTSAPSATHADELSPGYRSLRAINADQNLLEAYKLMLGTPQQTEQSNDFLKLFSISYDDDAVQETIRLASSRPGIDHAFIEALNNAQKWAALQKNLPEDKLLALSRKPSHTVRSPEKDQSFRIHYKRIAQQKDYWLLLRRTTSSTHLYMAYDFYHGGYGHDIDKQRALNHIRLFTLLTDADAARSIVQLMKKRPAIDFSFSQLVETTIPWAEEQKARSSDELRNMAQNLPDYAKPPETRKSFSSAFEEIAIEKDLSINPSHNPE